MSRGEFKGLMVSITCIVFGFALLFFAKRIMSLFVESYMIKFSKTEHSHYKERAERFRKLPIIAVRFFGALLMLLGSLVVAAFAYPN